MKKFLPIFFLIVFSTSFLFGISKPVFADTPSAPSSVSLGSPGSTLTDNSWYPNEDVTFAGKAGARAEEFLNWALQNYNWASPVQNTTNPIQDFWVTIRNIVYAFFALFILVTAFLLIVTRGKSITIRKFIPRFLLVVLLVFFSFALVQFLYQIVDIVQGFFLRNPDGGAGQISSHNLLSLGFHYGDFLGYQKAGMENSESAFVSLLLVKLTALTYYVMVGVLVIRKIILWFFIIISPLFPLLLFYNPIRNTGKIWVGEFFRWLLYAPLFAIFLSGLVHLWRAYIPLQINTTNADYTYPTAINILLGGPNQSVSLVNSVNNKDTFALYLVALLMLWVVIILPFLLLQIFLDYLKTVSFEDNALLGQLLSAGGFGKPPVPQTPKPVPPPQGAGLAKSLPFSNKISIPESIVNINRNIGSIQRQTIQSVGSSAEILKLSNLQVPTIRDIAQYEGSILSPSIGRRQEVASMHESLEKIAAPAKVTQSLDRQKFSTIKEKLISEKQKGNPLATSILSAVNVVSKGVAVSQADIGKLKGFLQNVSNPESITSTIDRQKYESIDKQLEDASRNGDDVATMVLNAGKNGQVNESLAERLLDAKEKGSQTASLVLQAANISVVSQGSVSVFPVINRVQTVSLDDYEAVKNMWEENYQKIDPPKDALGREKSRGEWIKNEMEKITNTISLLLSADPQKVNKGMEQVGAILPFLLIGGFSKTEIVAYLKAKYEAAKATETKLVQKTEEEETQVGRVKEKQEKPKELHEEVEEKEEDA